MASVPNRRFTVQEYLAREELALEKSEYYRGEVFAMTGGTPNHSRISLSLAFLIRSHLQGHKSCEVFGSDQRVHIDRVGLFTYPDASIACDAQFERNSLVNPRVICEVLSESTERYDRVKKFAFYRQLDSLEEYILVSQDSPSVERFVKQSDGNWLWTIFQGLESTFEIAAISFQGSLTELYRNVEFLPPETEPPASSGTDRAPQ